MNSFVALVCVLSVARAADPFDWSKIIKNPSLLARKFLAEPRVVGGQEAVPHEFPFQAALRIDGRSFCSGCLISEFYILTAAHCVDQAKSVEIILGAHNIQQNEVTQRTYTTTDIKVHEGWNRLTLANDVALLRVASGMELTNEIQIIRLPSSSQEEETFTNRRANVSGWGRFSDSSGRLSPVLRYVESSIIGNNECRSYFGIIRDSHICLSGAQGKGACNGDSGGPLTVTETDGVRTLIGISSFGSGWGCEWGFPTAYARVTAFLEWILANATN